MTNARLHLCRLIALCIPVLLSVAARAGDIDLLKGAVWRYSADGGKTYDRTAASGTQAAGVTTHARATFRVDDPAACGSLRFAQGGRPPKAAFALNGKPVAGPVPSMLYHEMPLDPAKYLVRGENVLTIAAQPHRGAASIPATPDARLIAQDPAPPALYNGPALGAIGPDFFSMTLRTAQPAEVVVTATPVDPKGAATSATSPRGFNHRLRVPLSKGTARFTYQVTLRAAGREKTEGPFAARVPCAKTKALRFAVAGDCRSNPRGWRAVAETIRKSDPDLLLFTGDMVGDGRFYSNWHREFFSPAKELLRTVPFYGVMGNHDGSPAICGALLYSPGEDGRADNWTQVVGDVLFVGLNGLRNWSPGSENVVWLEDVLKASKQKFVFVLTHYPAFSSGKHAAYGEKTMLLSRQVVMPVLVKHNATAMLAGHDHNYERSEPPAGKGVTSITAGGAGAKLRPKSGRGSRTNPYSKVFHATLHYCLFDVAGDTCAMKVYSLRGSLLDQATFTARKIP